MTVDIIKVKITVAVTLFVFTLKNTYEKIY